MGKFKVWVTGPKPKPAELIVFVMAVFTTAVLLVGLKAAGRQSCVFYIESDTGRKCVSLEKAATASQREQGLSGVNNLAQQHGMLFVFEESEMACMWMKDMKFSLDIVWLDGDRKITKIEENVSPETYPQSFCANEPSKYVIEVNAGVASQANLKLGQQLKL